MAEGVWPGPTAVLARQDHARLSRAPVTLVAVLRDAEDDQCDAGEVSLGGYGQTTTSIVVSTPVPPRTLPITG